MPVRLKIPYDSGLFFITFTCARWLPLIKQTNSYDLFYKWFDYLKHQGHFINAYVIMPNHFHAIIGFRKSNKSINKIIGEGKRFMSYELIKRLNNTNQIELLKQLNELVNRTDAKRMKKHEVFEPSFDWKLLYTNEFITQKLNYIHQNPCKSKYQLAKFDVDYEHSSARRYAGECSLNYAVTLVSEMKHVDLTIPQSPLRETSAGTGEIDVYTAESPSGDFCGD